MGLPAACSKATEAASGIFPNWLQLGNRLFHLKAYLAALGQQLSFSNVSFLCWAALCFLAAPPIKFRRLPAPMSNHRRSLGHRQIYHYYWPRIWQWDLTWVRPSSARAMRRCCWLIFRLFLNTCASSARFWKSLVHNTFFCQGSKDRYLSAAVMTLILLS